MHRHGYLTAQPRRVLERVLLELRERKRLAREALVAARLHRVDQSEEQSVQLVDAEDAVVLGCNVDELNIHFYWAK